MKVFITGAGGQLARSFSEINSKNELHLVGKEDLDVTNLNQVLQQVAAFKPDIIFHFASMTRGDECTKNPDRAYEINVNGTKNIVEAAKKNKCTVLFVSTNEVFDGEKKSAYTEEDIPNPRTVAGYTKYEAEKVIKESLTRYFIIRTSWLFSKWSNNFLHAVLEKAGKNQKIELVADEISSPTYSYDLAESIEKLIKTKKYGIYHLSNSGQASRLEFAKKAFEVCGIKNIEIIPVKLEDYVRLSKPPLFTALSNNKAKKMGIEFLTWQDALERFLTLEMYGKKQK